MLKNVEPVEKGPLVAYDSLEEFHSRAWFTYLEAVTKVPDPHGYSKGAFRPVGDPWKPRLEELQTLKATPDTDPNRVVRIVRVPLARSFAGFVIAVSQAPGFVPTANGPEVAIADGVLARVDGLSIRESFGAPTTTVTTARPGASHSTPGVTADIRLGMHPDRWKASGLDPTIHHMMLEILRQPKDEPVYKGFLRRAMVVLGVTIEDITPEHAGDEPNYRDVRRWRATRPAGSVIGLMIDHGRLEETDGGYINHEAWVADTDTVIHDAAQIRQGTAMIGAAFIDQPSLAKLESAI